MDKMVTGSVAESVAPTDKASTKDMLIPSSPKEVQMNKMVPNTIADMSVPGIANVRIDTMLLKKLTWFNSYPELRIIGGKSTLKKYDELNVTVSWI